MTQPVCYCPDNESILIPLLGTQRHHNHHPPRIGEEDGREDRDKTPTAHLASPPPAAESNSAQSTISRLENKYADILNKIARRKKQEAEGGGADWGDDLDGYKPPVKASIRHHDDEREKTLEADHSTKSKVESSTKEEAIRSALAKSATVIHIPSEKKASALTSKPAALKTGLSFDKEERSSGHLKDSDHVASAVSKSTKNLHNHEDADSLAARYKLRSDRDTSNRYKDTSDLMDSLKGSAPKSSYNHFSHYDKPAPIADPPAGPSSSYYKSRYDPDSYGDYGYGGSSSGSSGGGGVGNKAAPVADKPGSSSAAARRTKSYRTRKEASKERKHLTMKLSAVNMDIDSPPPTSAAAPKASAGTSASGRSYKTYGAARKSQGSALGGSGYQRSQTQKLLYDFDDDDIYHPPTQRDNRRKEIQNVIRKYAQYDDDDLRRTTANPYSNPMKSATSANLAYNSRDAAAAGSSAYSDRRDPIAEHYGLGYSAGASYYPRSHYGCDPYASYVPGGRSAAYNANPYSSSAAASSAALANPYNPLSKTHSTAAFYNSAYAGGGSAAGASSSAAALRSRKNLMSFVRILYCGR